jgi:hypothetical protein
VLYFDVQRTDVALRVCGHIVLRLSRLGHLAIHERPNP